MLNQYPTFKFIFLGIDILIISVSFFWSLTLYVSDFWSFFNHSFFYYYSYFFLYLSILLIFLFSFRFNDLYKRNIVVGSRNRQFFILIKAMLVGSIISILFMVITNVSFFYLYGKGIIFSSIVYSLILLILFRVLMAKGIFYFLSKKQIPPKQSPKHQR